MKIAKITKSLRFSVQFTDFKPARYWKHLVCEEVLRITRANYK